MNDRLPRIVILCALGSAVVLIAASVAALSMWPTAEVALGAAVTCGVGLFMYLRIGAERFAPSSVFFLAVGFLGGLMGIYLVWIRDSVSEGLRSAVLLVALATLLSAIVVRAAGSERLAMRSVPWGSNPISVETARFVRFVGLALILIGSASLSLRALGPFSQACLYLAVLFMCFATASQYREHPRLAVTRFAPLLGVSVALYLLLVFNGFGRIQVAELGLACLICINLLQPAKWQKGLVLVALGPGLVVAGLSGMARMDGDGVDVGGLTVAELTSIVRQQEGGLGSATDPLEQAAALVDLESSGVGDLPMLYGSTLADGVLIVVPRALWPGKPVQTGRMVVEYLVPRQAGSDLSLAVGLWGEGFMDFRYVGFVGLPVVFAWLIARLDYLVPRLWVGRGSRVSAILSIAVASTVSSIPDLVWGGIGTFGSRGGTRLVLLVALVGGITVAGSSRSTSGIGARRSVELGS